MCIQAAKTIAVMMQPFMPFSAEKIWKMLGFTEQIQQQLWDDCNLDVPQGQPFGKVEILFEKIMDERIQPEIERLQNISNNKTTETPVVTDETPKISFDDLKK